VELRDSIDHCVAMSLEALSETRDGSVERRRPVQSGLERMGITLRLGAHVEELGASSYLVNMLVGSVHARRWSWASVREVWEKQREENLLWPDQVAMMMASEARA
jgi:hypothetical protein